MKYSNTAQKAFLHNCANFAKMLILALSVLFLSMQMAFAVDVNRASLAELDTIKGIGLKKGEAIIAERNANGPFKDAADLAARVKGLGDKSVSNLMQAGLMINGSSAPAMGNIAPQSTKNTGITTIAPRGKPAANTAGNAPVDFSGGQTSVTQNNNSNKSTGTAATAMASTKSKEAKSPKMTADSQQPTAAMPVQAIEPTKRAKTDKTDKTDKIDKADKVEKATKQGLPKPAAEMTIQPATKTEKPAKAEKPAKEAKAAKAAPANMKMETAKPAANQ